MAAWLSKWGPLAGVLTAVLITISFVNGNSTPDDNATGQHVIQWYTTHHNQQILSDVLVGLAMFFLVVFAATLTRHIRRGDRWIATGALGGAVATAIGFTCLLGFDLVLATDTKDLTPASAQTLNLLQNDFFLPAVLGFGLLASSAVLPWSPAGSCRCGWAGCCSSSASRRWSRRSPGSRSWRRCCGC